MAVYIIFVILCSALISPSYAIECGSGNRAYVTVLSETSEFYARCLPNDKLSHAGATHIMKVDPAGDRTLLTYPWYNKNGLAMGWSPTAGKFAMLRIRPEWGLPIEKQIELSFYLGEALVRSYTTAELIKRGMKAESFILGIRGEKDIQSTKAQFRVEGCKQANGSNDYYFSLIYDENKRMLFDITTGKISRLVTEKDSRQRLEPIDSSSFAPVSK